MGLNNYISVIIPVHNREKEIVRALDSILIQYDQVHEIIVIDDASTDTTCQIVEELAKQHQCVRLIRLPKNHGATYARNVGIDNAQSDLIAFLDSDDEWMQGKVAKQIACFAADPDLAMVYTGMEVYDGNTVVAEPAQQSEDLYDELLRWNLIGSTSTCMVKKEVLVEVGKFDEQLKARQDLDLWLRIAEHNKIVGLSEPLVRFHTDNNDRISTNLNNQISGAEYFINKHYAALSRHPYALARNYLRLAKFYSLQGHRRDALRYYTLAFQTHKNRKTIKNYLFHRITTW